MLTSTAISAVTARPRSVLNRRRAGVGDGAEAGVGDGAEAGVGDGAEAGVGDGAEVGAGLEGEPETVGISVAPATMHTGWKDEDDGSLSIHSCSGDCQRG